MKLRNAKSITPHALQIQEGKEKMRESFVFHAEYIDDLPNEFKLVFAMYAINYGIYGEEPTLTGLEVALWAKIKRRIDYDIEGWESTKKNRSKGGSNHKGNQYSKKKESEQVGTNGTERNRMEQNGTNGTVYVSVNDSVSVDDDGDDSVNVGFPPENSPPPPPFLSEPQENYSKIVFDKFKDAGLPCQNGDFFKFQSCDFRLALQKLRSYSSNDVISAVDNYITELRNPESYVDKEFSFASFVESKTFQNCLPANYRAGNFKKFERDKPKAEEGDGKKHFYEKCLKCGLNLMEWSNPIQKYKCASCGSTFTFEEVDNVREHITVS